MLAKLVIALALLLLAGCDRQTPEQKKLTDAENAARAAYRDQMFAECMRLLPAGPESTKYNDWDEVVSECSSISWYHMNTRFGQ